MRRSLSKSSITNELENNILNPAKNATENNVENTNVILDTETL